jgi:AraC family transcriptional regulator
MNQAHGLLPIVSAPDEAPLRRPRGKYRADTIEAHLTGVRRAIVTMRQRMDGELLLGEIASSCAMSPFHFDRVFHEVTGVPPRQYLSALRIQTAQRLLLTTDAPIIDICFNVGYTSVGTFTRRFHWMAGVAPKSFRALARALGGVTFETSHELGGTLAPSTGRVLVTGSLQLPAQAEPTLAMVGLFPDAMAQGRPLACCLTAAPGNFALSSFVALPEGRYELLAASVSPGDLDVLHERVLRARCSLRLAPRHGPAVADLVLCPPQDIDPPIVSALPVLLAERLSR